MEPEDQFNEYVYYVLKQLKEEKLLTGEGESVVYDNRSNVIAPGIPSKRRKAQIIDRLQEWGCLEIQSVHGEPESGVFELNFKQPNFDEAYRKFKELNNHSDSSNTQLSNHPDLTISQYEYHIRNLQRILDSFIDLPDKDFFRGIADYIKYIDENDDLEPLVNRIIEIMNSQQEDIKNVEERLKEEVFVTYKTVTRIITDNEITDGTIKESVADFDSVVSRHTQYSSPMEEALYSSACGIVRALVEAGHPDLIADYVTTDERGSITAYKVAKSYGEYEVELENFRSLKTKTVWGAWNELIRVYLLIHRYKEELERIRNKNDIWRQLNFIEEHKVMESVLEGKNLELNHFNKDAYLYNVRKVHTFFVQQLERMVGATSVATTFRNQLMALTEATNAPMKKIRDQLRAINQPFIQLAENANKSVQAVNAAMGTISVQDFSFPPYDPINKPPEEYSPIPQMVIASEEITKQNTDRWVYPKPYESAVIPDKWALAEDAVTGVAYILYDGEPVYTFFDRTSKKYLCFKYIWINFGNGVSYEKTYDYWLTENGLERPTTKQYVLNKGITRQMRMLRDDFQNFPLSVLHLEINNSFTLTTKKL